MTNLEMADEAEAKGWSLDVPRLRQARNAMEISMANMADKMLMAYRVLGETERGGRKITAEELARWATITKRPPNYFYGQGPR